MELDDNEIGMCLDALEYKINRCAGEIMTFSHERELVKKLKRHMMKRMGWANREIEACLDD